MALAKALKAGCFHQVSSIAAAGLYEGTFTEDMFEEAGALDHPYFQTKHESEGIVRAEKRLKWRIYRPGMVVGHSRTGEMDKVDGPLLFLRGPCTNLSSVVPEGFPLLMNKAGLLNIVPVGLRGQGHGPSGPPARSRSRVFLFLPTRTGFGSAMCSRR